MRSLSKYYDTENLKIQTLLNSKVISPSYEIILESDDTFDGCVLLGDLVDASQGVVEASDRISKRMYEKYPSITVFN